MSIARFNPPAFSRSALAAQIAFDGIARRLGLLAKAPKLADFQSAGAAASTHQLQLVVIEWDKFGDKYIFSVCPAELTFHKAFRLKMEVDYLTPTAGMCPWAIETIDREPLEFATGFKSYRWSISINWPRGSFQFESPEFTLELRGKPVLRSDQWLSSEDRAFK